VFAPLPAPVVAQLAPRFLRANLSPGVDSLRYNDGPPGLVVIESGRLARVVRRTGSPTVRIIETLGPRDIIGASALVQPAPDFEYIVLQPAVVHLLPKDVFAAVLRQVPSFAVAIAQAIAKEAKRLTRHGAIPWTDLESLSLDERLWASLPPSLTARPRLCPIDYSDGVMTVAMIDPREVAALDELSEAAPGVRFHVVACSPDDLRRLIGRRAGASPSYPPATGTPAQLTFQFLADEAPSRERGRAGSTPPPAVSAIEEILGVGLGARASDIHIEPERQAITIRYRVNGDLQRRPDTLPIELAKPIAIRIKSLARLDITDTRRPQDGRISVRLSTGRLVDLRVSTIPAKFGEKIALRILDSEVAITDLKTLFAVDAARALFSRLITRQTGFLLATGPAGSGKSTTLYSGLNACRAQDVNIMTVEDPIEYHVDGVTQVEVHPEAGKTFAAVLRALLRQDPDIILVGEMRDAETARIAVEASLTGHLVMSSLHTNGSLEAIARMQDMGIEPYALANGLLAVLHQRLVQRICPDCVAPFEYPSFVTASLARFGITQGSETQGWMRGAGCARCRGTGMLGRVAVYGILTLTDDVRDAMSRKASLSELRAVAARSGAHLELAQYAAALLRMGLTVPSEVIPLLQHPTVE
jgi:type IV pilus assembly protein PilB